MKSNPEIQALMNRISAMIQNQDENSPLEVLFSHYSEFCYTQNKSEASLQQDPKVSSASMRLGQELK